LTILGEDELKPRSIFKIKREIIRERQNCLRWLAVSKGFCNGKE
jgi:hypothetical protein